MSHNFFFKYQQCRLNWVPTMCWASCFHCSLDKYVLRTYHVHGSAVMPKAESVRSGCWVFKGWRLPPTHCRASRILCHQPAFMGDETLLSLPVLFLNLSETEKKAQILTLHCILEHVLSAGGGLSYLHFILHKVDTAVAGSSPPRLPVQNVVKISGLEMYSLRLQRLMGGLSF